MRSLNLYKGAACGSVLLNTHRTRYCLERHSPENHDAVSVISSDLPACRRHVPEMIARIAGGCQM
jgi:hypothetical protein